MNRDRFEGGWRQMDKMKGSRMKTIWDCVLLSSLSIVAYSGFSVALSGSVQLPSEMPASPSIAASPAALNAPVGAIALDASSGRPVLGSTPNDNYLAANLSTYLFFHKTWNENMSAPTPAGLSVCSE